MFSHPVSTKVDMPLNKETKPNQTSINWDSPNLKKVMDKFVRKEILHFKGWLSNYLLLKARKSVRHLYFKKNEQRNVEIYIKKKLTFMTPRSNFQVSDKRYQQEASESVYTKDSSNK